jgi:hypothetical protein
MNYISWNALVQDFSNYGKQATVQWYTGLVRKQIKGLKKDPPPPHIHTPHAQTMSNAVKTLPLFDKRVTIIFLIAAIQRHSESISDNTV